MVCGLEASVIGKKLYEALMFETLETVTVQVPGEVEKAQFIAMRREPKTEKGNLKGDCTSLWNADSFPARTEAENTLPALDLCRAMV